MDLKQRTANKGFASGGLKFLIQTLVHFKNFCTLAERKCIKTRPNAKPRNVTSKRKD